MKLLTTIFIFVLMSVHLLSDSFSILPGTKAKGMAGAYSAIVEDTTAGYYNPAGYMVFFQKDSPNFNYVITTEVIDILSFNNFRQTKLKDKLSKKKKPFLGISATTSKFGMGLSFYSVYDYILKNRNAVVDNTYSKYNNPNTTPKKLYANIDFFHQKADIVQLGGAYNLYEYDKFNSKVSIGASIGISLVGGEYGTSTDADDLKQYYIDDKGNKQTYSTAFSRAVYSGIYSDKSLFYGFGVKARLYDSDEYTLSTGLSFKTASESKIKSSEEKFGLDYDGSGDDNTKGSAILNIPSWGVPSSRNLSLALNVKKDIGFFTFAYENSTKNFAEVTDNAQGDINTNAFGLEASLMQYHVQLRVGRYSSTSSNSSDISSDAWTLGLSYIPQGLGAILDYSTIDVSVEMKTYKQGDDMVNLNLISISLNHEII